jgi:hypothetical protein
MSRLSRKCGSLDVSQPYEPPWPVTGIASPFSLSLSLSLSIYLRISIFKELTAVSLCPVAPPPCRRAPSRSTLFTCFGSAAQTQADTPSLGHAKRSMCGESPPNKYYCSLLAPEFIDFISALRRHAAV